MTMFHKKMKLLELLNMMILASVFFVAIQTC